MTETETLLRERLADLRPTTLEVSDDSAAHAGHAGARSGGGHFSVVVVSEFFAGLSRVARHQAVYGRVRDLIPHRVHALAIRALAPGEFH